MTSLFEMSTRLRTAERLDAVLAIVRTAARGLARSDGATVVLRDNDACFYADEDSVAPLWKGQRFPISDCISGWAMLNNAAAIVPDITVDERIPQAAYRPTYVRSLVMVPIGRVTPIGAIGAYWGREHSATAQEVSDLEALADLTDEALHRIGLDDAPWAPNFAQAIG